MSNDAATAHMIGLLRSLADELEAGNGVAISRVSVNLPLMAVGDTTYTRNYSLLISIRQPRPEALG